MPQPCHGSYAYSHVVKYNEGAPEEYTDVESFLLKEAGVWLTSLATGDKWVQLPTPVTVRSDCQYFKVGDLRYTVKCMFQGPKNKRAKIYKATCDGAFGASAG